MEVRMIYLYIGDLFCRDCGLHSSVTSDDTDTCAVCLERACTVSAEGLFFLSCAFFLNTILLLFVHVKNQQFVPTGCGHEFCTRCALYLCSTSNIISETAGLPGSIPCPLCRYGIISFAKLPSSPEKETKLHLPLGLCTPCMLHHCDPDRPSPTSTLEIRKNRVASVSPDLFCPVSCSPFPSVPIPLCTCHDGPCPTSEPPEGDTEAESPATSTGQDKIEGLRLERTSCSSMFWSRRSCSREQQCNSEINA